MLPGHLIQSPRTQLQNADYRCSRRVSVTPPAPNSEGASNLSRSTLGLDVHPGRHPFETRFLTTPLCQAPQNPSLAHGRNSLLLKSAQFSFAFVPLAEGRDPSTSNPDPGRPTHPHHSASSSHRAPIRFCSSYRPPPSTASTSVTSITPLPHLYLIQTQDTPALSQTKPQST